MKIILTIIGNNPAYLSSRYGYMYLTFCKQNQNKKSLYETSKIVVKWDRSLKIAA